MGVWEGKVGYGRVRWGVWEGKVWEGKVGYG